METGNKKQLFGARGKKRLLQVLSVVSMLAAAGYASLAQAIPITYNVTDEVATGSLGGVAFTDQLVTFSMTADTDNVIYASLNGTNFAYNSIGTVSVNVYSTTGGIAMSAVFDAGQLYFGVDNTNNGIGFGMLDAAGNVSDPVYPYDVIANDAAAIASYDLASNISGLGSGLSCSGFPNTCANTATNPVILTTTLGDFYITNTAISGAFFSVQTSQPVSTVSEPDSLAILPLGLGILGMFRRKRSKPRMG